MAEHCKDPNQVDEMVSCASVGCSDQVSVIILDIVRVSHPGNLTKSNSDDLRSSPVSTPELRSNESLYQESDIPLNH